MQRIRVIDGPVGHCKVNSNIQIDLASSKDIVEKTDILLQFELLDKQLIIIASS